MTITKEHSMNDINNAYIQLIRKYYSSNCKWIYRPEHEGPNVERRPHYILSIFPKAHDTDRCDQEDKDAAEQAATRKFLIASWDGHHHEPLKLVHTRWVTIY